MNQQPEALLMADDLDAYHTRSIHKESAIELRRLHEENEALRKDAAEVERRTIEKCVAVIQSYQIPYGNSAAGEIAAEMTLSMLREVRDEIRALANQQEAQNG